MLQYCGIDLTAGVCNFVESWIIKTYQNTETNHILSPCIAHLNNTFSYCHHYMQNLFFFSLAFAVADLMHLACSSVLCGGGTNQELAHHCLYECKGDIMVSSTEQSILTATGITMNNKNITGSCTSPWSDSSQVFF